MYSITIHQSWQEGPTYTQNLSYEEMVEILAAIRDTPVRGNELFDSAKYKAQELMNKMPTSDY